MKENVQNATLKPSKKMCQPYTVLRRTLTVPPSRKLRDSDATDEELSPRHSKKTKVGFEGDKEEARDRLSPSSTVTFAEIEHPERISGQGKDEKSRIEFGAFNGNDLKRRKSYESLDVINGKTSSPVNITARQRLLKVG